MKCSLGGCFGYAETDGFCPVFRLKQGVKIESGDGTPDNPYTLAP